MLLKTQSKINIRLCWICLFLFSVLLNTFFIYILHKMSNNVTSLEFHELYYSWGRKNNREDNQFKPLKGWSESTKREEAIINRLQNGETYGYLKTTQPVNGKSVVESRKPLTNEQVTVKRLSSNHSSLFLSLPTTGTPLQTTGTPLQTTGTPLPTSGTPLPTTGTPLPTTGTPLQTTGTPLKTNHTTVKVNNVNTTSDENKTSLTTTETASLATIIQPERASRENLDGKDKRISTKDIKIFRKVEEQPQNIENQTGISSLSRIESNGKNPTVAVYSNLQPGLIVDWYKDVFISRTMYNLKWHPHFPHMPRNTTIMKTLTEKTYWMKNFARRIYGFLIPDETSKYEFEIGSRDGIEFILLDAQMSRENIQEMKDVNSLNILLNVSFTVEEMITQDKQIGYYDIFTKNVSIHLEKGRVYFLDIIQGGGAYGRLNIKWRYNNRIQFEEINVNHLFHDLSKKHTLHKYTVHKKPQQLIQPSPQEQLVMKFNKIKTFTQDNLLPSCNPFIKHKKHIRENIGVLIVEQWAVYPEQGYAYYKPHNRSDVVLNETEALYVVNQTFEAFKKNFNSNSTPIYKNLVQVYKNFDISYKNLQQEKQFYFVEFDVFIGNETERVTKYVQFMANKKLCFRNEFNWRRKQKIYLMTPVRNQAQWIHHLLHSIEQIIDATDENNVELILVDYNSTDANITHLLQNHRVPYKYILKSATMFNKVQGLNIALNHTEDGSIAFVLDLHLELPNDLFDKIRKHTIEGVSAYCPTLIKLYRRSHQLYTEYKFWQWMDMGYGMISLYKSDWMALGGMDEKKFGTAWGGEDWDLVDRLFSNGYYLFHIRLPRFYHIHHSNHDIWDGTKL